MSSLNLRKRKRICYYEPEEPPFDEYIYCTECRDYVYEYCSIHGPLLVVPDDKVVDANHKPTHIVDAQDPETSNWMRYVNCSRHCSEQNLVAYQYQGQIYYRTIKIIPRFTELLVFYGSEFARELGVDVRRYRSPGGPCACPRCQPQETENPASTSVKTKKRQADTKEKSVSEKVAKISPFEKNLQAPKPASEKGETNNASTIQPISNKPNFHVQKTNDEPKLDLKCDQCKEIFISKTVLVKHVRTHSLDIKKTDGALTKLITKTECEKCKISFATNAELAKHLYTHMIKTPADKNACKSCNTKFESNMCLMEHMERQHNVKFFSCTECVYRTSNEDCLVEHRQTHVRELINKGVGSGCNYSSKEKNKLGKKSFKCNYCNYACSDKSYLSIHERVHTGEKPYKCDICAYQAAHSNSLKTHVMSKHAGEKPFKCSYCNYASSQICDLSRHTRTHTGEKPYKCDICDYQAAHSHNLKTHMSKHAGEKPFKCSYCNYASSEKSNLSRHERTHTGEKPYKCDICGYQAAHSHSLKIHVMSKHAGEKPFKCSYCNYASSQKCDLSSHERAHTGEKPYKCDICEYKTAYSSNLKRHLMRTHAGVKP